MGAEHAKRKLVSRLPESWRNWFISAGRKEKNFVNLIRFANCCATDAAAADDANDNSVRSQETHNPSSPRCKPARLFRN